MTKVILLIFPTIRNFIDVKILGNIASIDSSAPFVEPGSAITYVSPIIPARLLESIEYGVRNCP